MEQIFYILRNGWLIRKHNTIYFICKGEEKSDGEKTNNQHSFAIDVDGEEETIETENVSDKPEYEKRIIPIEKIHTIFAIGRVSLTSGVLSYLSKYNVPLHFFGYYGNYEGTFWPKEKHLSGEIHIRQAEHYLNGNKRATLARSFATGSAHNILRNLEYYLNEGTDLQNEIDMIRKCIDSLEIEPEISKILAGEGFIRQIYYSTFDKILDNKFRFDSRSRQPPENPLNAMLSFGNSLLYGIVITEIYHTQLDPTISYLHEPSERRFSLALDISEIFKPFFVDRIIFKLVNKNMVGDEHFVKELNSCLLNERGKRIFLAEWDEKLKSTIKHRELNRNVSYQRLVYLECLKLIKHLLNIKEYKPFVIWW